MIFAALSWLKQILKKEHLAIFYLSNKQRHGGRVKCLRRSSRVFARKPGLKNGKEAIFVGFPGFRGSLPAPLLHFVPQRLRRPSNPCRACICKHLPAHRNSNNVLNRAYIIFLSWVASTGKSSVIVSQTTFRFIPS